jgi:hypothetical protein
MGGSIVGHHDAYGFGSSHNLGRQHSPLEIDEASLAELRKKKKKKTPFTMTER